MFVLYHEKIELNCKKVAISTDVLDQDEKAALKFQQALTSFDDQVRRFFRRGIIPKAALFNNDNSDIVDTLARQIQSVDHDA